MYYSKFLYGFFKVAIWICLSFYMDLSKLLLGFVKVVTWICQRCSIFSRTLPNKTELKFDQDFKVCWSFFSELMVLIVNWLRVKVFNALGAFCLWQCLFLQCISWLLEGNNWILNYPSVTKHSSFGLKDKWAHLLV